MERSGANVLTALVEVQNATTKSFEMNCKQIAGTNCVPLNSLWPVFGQKMLTALLWILLSMPFLAQAQPCNPQIHDLQAFQVSLEAVELVDNKVELEVSLHENTVPLANVTELALDLDFSEALPSCSVSLDLDDTWICSYGHCSSVISQSGSMIHIEVQRDACTGVGGQGPIARIILDFANEAPPLEALESAALGGIVIMDDISMKSGPLGRLQAPSGKPTRTELWSIEGKKVLEFVGDSGRLPKGVFIRRQHFESNKVTTDKLLVK